MLVLRVHDDEASVDTTDKLMMVKQPARIFSAEIQDLRFSGSLLKTQREVLTQTGIHGDHYQRQVFGLCGRSACVKWAAYLQRLTDLGTSLK